jgi:hypothetical protein
MTATVMAPDRARRQGGRRRERRNMTLVILEALGAGVLLVGIVWWTMFSGRRGGERVEDRTDRGDGPPSR